MPAADVLGDAVCGARPGRFPAREAAAETCGGLGGAAQAAVDCEAFGAKCKAFRFDRFVALIEALADVVEGKREYDALPAAYKEAFDDIFQEPESTGQRSWFQRRMFLFFDILKNGKKYRDFGYTSMPSFLFNSMWTHFFHKEVRL